MGFEKGTHPAVELAAQSQRSDKKAPWAERLVLLNPLILSPKAKAYINSILIPKLQNQPITVNGSARPADALNFTRRYVDIRSSLHVCWLCTNLRSAETICFTRGVARGMNRLEGQAFPTLLRSHLLHAWADPSAGPFPHGAAPGAPQADLAANLEKTLQPRRPIPLGRNGRGDALGKKKTLNIFLKGCGEMQCIEYVRSVL